MRTATITDALMNMTVKAECLQALCAAAWDTAEYGNAGNDRETINRLQTLLTVFTDELTLLQQEIDRANELDMNSKAAAGAPQPQE